MAKVDKRNRNMRRLQAPVWLSSYNWQYAGVEYDYERESHCDESGCNESGDYCRCSTIHSAHITEVRIPDIRTVLSNGRSLTEIGKYCLERLLVANKIWDPSIWEVKVCGGYYGQEVDGVELDPGIAALCDNDIRALLALKTDKERIEFVLVKEYGYILEPLKGRYYKVGTVDKEDLTYQDDHYHRLDSAVVNGYRKDYDLPRGLCLRKGDLFRLIDGYHRVAAGDGKLRMVIAS
jgi:hypothetical protein